MQKRTKIITASIIAGVLVLGATAAIAGPIVYRCFAIVVLTQRGRRDMATAQSGCRQP